MSIYADPKNIYDLLNSQTTRIREQDAEIERLEAEIARLEKLAPWHANPRAVIKDAGPWNGYYCRVLSREEGSRVALVRIIIEGYCHPYEFGEDAIEYITQEA